MSGFTKLALIFGIPVGLLLTVPLLTMKGSLHGARSRYRRRRPRARRHLQRWSGLAGSSRWSHADAKKLARETWDYLWSVEEQDVKPGAVIRRVEGEMGKHYGRPLLQSFKVRLHSNTGPIHWIIIPKDGAPIID